MKNGDDETRQSEEERQSRGERTERLMKVVDR